MMDIFRKAERKSVLTFFLIGLAHLVLLNSCSDEEFENTMQPSKDAINIQEDQDTINAIKRDLDETLIARVELFEKRYQEEKQSKKLFIFFWVTP